MSGEYNFCWKKSDDGNQKCSGYTANDGQKKSGICCWFQNFGNRKDGGPDSVKCGGFYKNAQTKYGKEKFDKYYGKFR